MNYKQQLMTLIMSGIARSVELEFVEKKKTYRINAFIYQGDYFEAVVEDPMVKQNQQISLEGILNIETLSEKEYRISYEKETLFLRGKK